LKPSTTNPRAAGRQAAVGRAPGLRRFDLRSFALFAGGLSAVLSAAIGMWWREEARMRLAVSLALAAALCLGGAPQASSEGAMIEDFQTQPETRWRFFTDSVMGGRSSGALTFAQEDGLTHARMTGRVSTANNGGFIQMRMDLSDPPPAGAAGLRLLARGDGQRYFVHLRTTGTLLPWQYYQAGFEAAPEWTEIRLPFAAFTPSGALLRAVPQADSLKSVGIVAFGRDHDAEIEVREVGFY